MFHVDILGKRERHVLRVSDERDASGGQMPVQLYRTTYTDFRNIIFCMKSQLVCCLLPPKNVEKMTQQNSSNNSVRKLVRGRSNKFPCCNLDICNEIQQAVATLAGVEHSVGRVS